MNPPPLLNTNRRVIRKRNHFLNINPFGEVPLLTYPLQSAPGSSSDHPPIWDQILNNQITMHGQLNEMDLHQKQLARRQWKMEYKLNRYFAQSGYSIESPPTTPTDDWGSISILSLTFFYLHWGKCMLLSVGEGI